jgi:hypothetical protein
MTFTPSPGLSPDSPPPGSPSIVAAASAVFGGSIKWWGYGLSIVGGALGLFVALWRDGGHPVWQGGLAAIAILIIPLIVLAMVLASPASFESGGGARRGVNGLIALPFVALLFSNLYHAQMDPWQPALPAALAAVVVLPLAWNIRNAPGLSSPLGMLTVVTVCAALYGYGATSVIDIQLDFSPGAVTPVQILDKHETHGRRSHSYYLSLPAWGPRTGPNAIEVSAATYGALNIGDSVCVTQHPGALGLAWFTSGLCPAAAPGSSAS